MSTTSSIGSGKTYATVALWDAAWATGGWIGQVYGELTSGAITLAAHATSVTDFTRLETGPGQSYRDNASVQSNALCYNAANGAGLRKNSTFADFFTTGAAWTSFRYLQFRHDGPAGQSVLNIAHDNCNVDSCIIEGNASGSTNGVLFMAASSATNAATNNIVISLQSGVVGIKTGNASTRALVNNTVVSPSDVSNSAAGISTTRGAGSDTAKNNAVFGFASSFSSTTLFSGSNNASDQTIGFGTSNQAPVVFSSQFQTVTTSGKDFRTKALADLLDHAVTDTTDIPGAIDAVGTSRPQGSAWDIGAWELIAAAAGAPFVNLFSNPVLRAAAAISFVAVTTQPLGTPNGYPSSQSPFAQLDWPNPTRALLNITSQTSQKVGMPFGYLSSDAPFAQRQWPNPVLGPYGFQRATSQPLGRLSALFPVVVQPPFFQTDWPNPVLRVRPVNTQPGGSPLLLCTLNGKGLKPFAQTQWPNPRGPHFFAVPQIVNYPAIFRSSGQPVTPWTPVPPTSGVWTPATLDTEIWTPQIPGVTTWTEQ